MFQKSSSHVASTSKLSVLATVAALGAATLPAADAEAGLMANVGNYPLHQLLANDPMYKMSVAVGRVGSLGESYASGVMIAPDVYINAGHYTPINGSTVAFHTEIVFGDNYNTSTERYTVRETQRFPGYVFGDTGTIDLGVGWTNEFIAGITSPSDFPGFVSGKVVPEDTRLTMVDYGNYGDATTGELPSLGDRLAGRASKWDESFAYSPTYYYSTFFDGSTALDILDYRGIDFSSGAGWWTESGYLAGLHIASSIHLVGSATSIVLDLTHLDIQSWLQPIIQDSWARYYAAQEQNPGNPGNPGGNMGIPEPTSAMALGLAAGALALRRRRV